MWFALCFLKNWARLTLMIYGKYKVESSLQNCSVVIKWNLSMYNSYFHIFFLQNFKGFMISNRKLIDIIDIYQKKEIIVIKEKNLGL